MEEDVQFRKKLASRRFLLTVAVLFFASLSMWLGKLEADNYENIIIYTLGIYVVGRPVGDRIKGMIDAKTYTIVQTVPDKEEKQDT